MSPARFPARSRVAKVVTHGDPRPGSPAAPALRIKIASEDWEFEQIHQLNHETFAGEIPQHQPVPARRLVDRFHEENTYVICLSGRHLVGMIAIRGDRPFSLDRKLPNLDAYLPQGRSICELRLLAVEKAYRAGPLLQRLLGHVWRQCLKQGYDVALISGTTRQQRLYEHLGFVAFGPLVGSAEARFQPMMLTLERFAPRAGRLFRRGRPAGRPATVSFLPGPVAVLDEVRRALREPAESHRSPRFIAEFAAVKSELCRLTGATGVEILLGSGTLANDAVAAQLSLTPALGLVLSNGEFGGRLVDHARRAGLAFEVMEWPWGEGFDLAAVERRLARTPTLDWLWLAHCETSTGVLNDLGRLAAMSAAAGVRLSVDAISSLGTVPLDLAGTYFASGVSGKGLGAFPGLAFVFSNHVIEPAGRLPRYLDLGLYATSEGVPFTHSSNLLHALHIAIQRVDWPQRFRDLTGASTWLRARLGQCGFRIVGQDASASPAVVTIALPTAMSSVLVGDELLRQGYALSVNSEYLRRRNWIQICLMGEPSRDELATVLDALCQLCAR